jgi:hypothetical protein
MTPPGGFVIPGVAGGALLLGKRIVDWPAAGAHTDHSASAIPNWLPHRATAAAPFGRLGKELEKRYTRGGN